MFCLLERLSPKPPAAYRQTRLLVVFGLLLGLCGGNQLQAAETGRISEFGITWSFAEPVTFGQFANDHYWVLAPVTVTNISPEYNGARHGWEVNPNDVDKQGFDDRIRSFDGSRVPSLPYIASAGESLVKTISVDDGKCRPCIKTASVLTVLGAAPPDGGRTVFRPPYFGVEKPLYSTNDLQLNRLPQLAPPQNAPSFDVIADRYAMAQLDHKSGWVGRPLHPVDAMPDYGSDIASRNASSALALMLNGTAGDKWPALVRYVNNGIDLYYMMKAGVTWTGAGGHGEGRKLPIVFTAVLLNNKQMMNAIGAARREVFGENAGMSYSERAGKVLYSQQPRTEKSYWQNITLDRGSRTIADPYGYIDGGHRPGGSYQLCCLSKPWKATATALKLMPELIPVFNSKEFLDYVDRWVGFGAWTQPDICAPADGVCSGGNNAGAACTSANESNMCTGENALCDLSANWPTNYGVTYGPDGNGACIKDNDPSDGIGRFPLLHGVNADKGYHGSRFADEMWAAYVTKTETPVVQPSSALQPKGLPGPPIWLKLFPRATK